MRTSAELFSWNRLRAWGNSRFVRTAYLWVILITVLANAFSTWHGDGGNSAPGDGFRFQPVLPFNWITFYFMALAFAVAHGLYAVRCPEVVRKYADFTEYRAHHLGFTHLVHQMAELFCRARVQDIEPLHFDLKAALQLDEAVAVDGDQCFEQMAALPSLGNRMRLCDWYRDLLIRMPNEGLLNDVFDVIREHAGRVHRLSMLLSGLFFRVGLLLFCLVILQTFLSVYALMAARHLDFWDLIFYGR